MKEANRFLNLWLVERDYGSAAAFLTANRPVCVPSLSSDTGAMELLPNSQAKETLMLLMKNAGDHLGPRDSLTEAIQPLPPVYDPFPQGLKAASGFPFKASEVPVEELIESRKIK